MSSNELVEFLLAQILDDGQRAKAAADAFLHGDRIGMPALHPSVHRHVYHWTSARVLREVDSKRQIIALHTPRAPGYDCPTCWDGAEDGTPVAFPCPTLRLMTRPYADAPGYRDEWRL